MTFLFLLVSQKQDRRNILQHDYNCIFLTINFFNDLQITNYDSVVLRKHKKSLMHPLKGAKSAYTSVLVSYFFTLITAIFSFENTSAVSGI